MPDFPQAAGSSPGESLSALLLAGRFEVRASSAYTLRLVEGLPEHGITAEVVCSDARKVPPDKRATLPIREYRHFDRPIWGRVVLEAIRRDYADAPPDLIHIQSPTVYPPALWLARQWDRPCVLTVPALPPPRVRFPDAGGRCRRVIAISRSVRDDLVKVNRVPGSAVTVIHSGVHLPDLPDPTGILQPDRFPVVGTAGPLEASKGLPYFLGAAAKVLRRRPEIEFLVCGAGPEEHNLRRLTKKLKLDGQVTFVPNLHDFTKSIEAMDVYCLPSLRQGLGATMLEAMSYARPVIATKVGGVEGIITDGRTGLVVPPYNSDRLAEGILDLLADPERARALGLAGRRTVREQFRVDQMVRRTAELYRGVRPDADV